MSLSCLIIDDEQYSTDLLSEYVYNIPTLILSFSTTNPLLALKYIQKNHIDLVITDLNMPALLSPVFS